MKMTTILNLDLVLHGLKLRHQRCIEEQLFVDAT